MTGTTHADAAIDLAYYNYYVGISHNDLEQGKAPNYNGIAFSTLPILGAAAEICEECQINDNKVVQFAGNGIVAEASTGGPTLNYSGITANQVMDNGKVGILIGANSENYYNKVVDNQVQGNHTNDCEGDTIGSNSTMVGTSGTADTWSNNIGGLSLPTGLCGSRYNSW